MHLIETEIGQRRTSQREIIVENCTKKLFFILLTFW